MLGLESPLLTTTTESPQAATKPEQPKINKFIHSLKKKETHARSLDSFNENKKNKKQGYSKPVLFLIFNKAFLSMTIIR